MKISEVGGSIYNGSMHAIVTALISSLMNDEDDGRDENDVRTKI